MVFLLIKLLITQNLDDNKGDVPDVHGKEGGGGNLNDGIFTNINHNYTRI